MNQHKKQILFRTLNIIALAIILVLVFQYKERFYAMMNPAGEKLVQHPAMEFAEGTWLNSRPVKLSDLQGKVVVVDFWTFDCINCRHVLPTLNEWYSKYKEKNVVFIGVHTPETTREESLDALKQFIDDWKIEYPVVTDNNYTTWNRYNVQFWPSTFLIDKKGTIRELHIGELGYSALEKKLQLLLDE